MHVGADNTRRKGVAIETWASLAQEVNINIPDVAGSLYIFEYLYTLGELCQQKLLEDGRTLIFAEKDQQSANAPCLANHLSGNQSHKAIGRQLTWSKFRGVVWRVLFANLLQICGKLSAPP